jgi:hypothetical protein
MFERDGSETLLWQAALHYVEARMAWEEFANLAKDRYSNDVTFGTSPHMRGHWLDRLAEIDADIADMKGHGYQEGPRVGKAEPVARPPVHHTTTPRFRRGEPVEIGLSSAKDWGTARMYYRHVNQAVRWNSAEMRWRDGAYHASIPAEYTKSPFALQYYFAVGRTVFPGFGEDLCGTPYFVVRS